MGAWGCPHDAGGECLRVPGRRCDPGMKGCVLHGRFVFSDPRKARLSRAGRRRLAARGRAAPPAAGRNG
ncbi:MAG TPA: hypothetical protein ENK20_09715 [Chromatiales bacterium]|nr:hypothetical protein [Chromatiales bacterium]